MIIDSSVFDSCYKDGKNFSYQFDTSDGSIILCWEWVSDGSLYRYGRMIGGIEVEQRRDLAFMISDIADERNWR